MNHSLNIRHHSHQFFLNEPEWRCLHSELLFLIHILNDIVVHANRNAARQSTNIYSWVQQNFRCWAKSTACSLRNEHIIDFQMHVLHHFQCRSPLDDSSLLLIGTIKYSTFLLSLFLAHTNTISLLALPIHLLFPFNLYPHSTLITLVVILLASEPMFSSVRPHPEIQSYQLNR